MCRVWIEVFSKMTMYLLVSKGSADEGGRGIETIISFCKTRRYILLHEEQYISRLNNII